MKEIFVERRNNILRIAIRNKGILEECIVEEENQGPLIGEIYKGRVKNIIPATNSIFVDIGLSKEAYLYYSNELKENGMNVLGIGDCPYDDLRPELTGCISAFTGNSGVGKSTLLNALLPDVERQTAAISQKLGRGRHTTREVTIFEAFGGRIADTPGFASLEASRAGFIPKENLEHAFPEFGPYLGACQFTGCSHRSEKGCAVRAALAEGKLSQTRYDSYCAMYDEVKDVKEWQRRG